jgi:PIN domain nuclease of toxin-antitoxin system
LTTYVLDSSAILRYIDDEAGADRVGEIFLLTVKLIDKMQISAIQWGEVAGKLRKRLGAADATRLLETLMPVELEVVTASADRAIRAATLRLESGIPYADAFALELAAGSAERLLVTADYDFKAATSLARIEFLPLK